jgi:predicted nuclease with TOPRIM domain
MTDELQARLATLKREFMVGQTQLKELEQQEANLRETLLRIRSAIQDLEKSLAESARKPK